MAPTSPASAKLAEEGKGNGLPAYEPAATEHLEAKTDLTNPTEGLGWATRNGLTIDSFRRRNAAEGFELNQSMKKRHLNMIAIGGSIGAGFFVGSGGALAKGGPGSLLIDFIIIGVMMFNVVYALGEMATMYPVSGSFYTYATRFIDPSFGFAMGYNYILQWAVVVPLELTVCGLTIQYWDKDHSVNVGVWITIFFVAIIVVNIFGTLGYAEEEFWASSFKLIATVIFLVIALIMVLGGGPKGSDYEHYQGAKLWYNPGAFNKGFYGFCAVFVTAAFSFSGTELVGLAAAESRNPAKSLPSAIKQVFWRISLFYILGMLFVGLLIPYTEPDLINSKAQYSSGDANTSPFVLVGKNAHLWGFDHFMNVVIIVSVLSIGVSGVYGGSRTLTALAQQGYAPKLFAYVDKSGRPLWSVLAMLAFGLLAYINLDASGPVIFDWLLALSGLAALFTWGSICLSHIRFRMAWAHNGHTLDEIPFTAIFGVWGSWVGLIIVALVIIAQLYVAIQDAVDKRGSIGVQAFFKSFLGFFTLIIFWVTGYLWKGEGWRRIADIDVDSGRREHDWEAIRAYQEKIASYSAWRRLYHTVF